MQLSLALLAALSAAASGAAAVVDPALDEQTKDYSILLDAKDGSPTATPDKMTGLASLKPAFVASLKASAGGGAPFSLHEHGGAGAGAVVQTTFVTNTTRLHVDHLPPDEDGIRRPVPAGDLVTILPLETNKKAYFDVDAKCFSIKKGRPIHFEGGHPHRTVVKSGSVSLLGPFHTKTLKNVGIAGFCGDGVCESEEGTPGLDYCAQDCCDTECCEAALCGGSCDIVCPGVRGVDFCTACGGCVQCTTTDQIPGCVYHIPLNNGGCSLQCISCESTCGLDNAVDKGKPDKLLIAGCGTDCKNADEYTDECA